MEHPARQFVRAVIADNLRMARTRARVTQDDVAERMRGLGFDTWSRATVSEVERRNRSVGVEELVALAVVYATPITVLMLPGPTTVDADEPIDDDLKITIGGFARALRGLAIGLERDGGKIEPVVREWDYGFAAEPPDAPGVVAHLRSGTGPFGAPRPVADSQDGE